MNDEKMTDLVLKISTELATLNAQMKSVLDKFASHEVRITNLEQNKTSFKESITKWLVLALIGSICVIATLTGSATLITKLLGAC